MIFKLTKKSTNIVDTYSAISLSRSVGIATIIRSCFFTSSFSFLFAKISETLSLIVFFNSIISESDNFISLYSKTLSNFNGPCSTAL